MKPNKSSGEIEISDSGIKGHALRKTWIIQSGKRFPIILLIQSLNVVILIYWYSWIPYPLYCGIILFNLVLDNGNIGFILLVMLLFPLINWISGFESKTYNFYILFLLLLIGLFFSFQLFSLLFIFIIYESLIILLLFILLLFIFSYYRIRTAFFLFIISIFGTIGFILSLLLILYSISSFTSLLIVYPFYIKIPSFPWFYWLPEVHCEVNSSISLFLAGLLLKLGIFGIIRFILSSFFLVKGFLSSLVISFSIIGLFLISCLSFRFIDLKKIIAFSSILHLNITLISIYSFNLIGLLCGIIISISHAFSSVSLFLFISLLFLKTYSRYFDSLFFISSTFRSFLLLFLLANFSFPGSFNFIAELLTLITIALITSFLSFSFLISSSFFFLYFFFIFNRKLPYQSSYSSFNCIQLLLLSQLVFIMFGIGCRIIFYWKIS